MIIDVHAHFSEEYNIKDALTAMDRCGIDKILHQRDFINKNILISQIEKLMQILGQLSHIVICLDFDICSLLP